MGGDSHALAHVDLVLSSVIPAEQPGHGGLHHLPATLHLATLPTEEAGLSVQYRVEPGNGASVISVHFLGYFRYDVVVESIQHGVYTAQFEYVVVVPVQMGHQGRFAFGRLDFVHLHYFRARSFYVRQLEKLILYRKETVDGTRENLLKI